MQRRTKKNRFPWAIVILAAVGLAVRLPYVASRSLWFDEAFSWRLIQFPFGEFLGRAAADVHPILYYVVLWLWMLPARTFGPEGTLVWMRLLSVFLGATTVAAMVVAGRVLFRSYWIGVVAGLFTAVSAFQVQYAWEARMYTLGTALLPLAMASLARVVTARPAQRAWRTGLGFGLALALLLHVHYYALFSWVALGGAKLLYFFRRMLRDVSAVISSVNFRAAEVGFWMSGVFFLPWLPVFLAQAERVEAAFWIPRFRPLSIPITLARLFWGGVRDVPPWWAALAAVAALGLVLLPLVRGRSFGDVIAAMSFAIPLLLSAVVSFRTSVFLDRYFLFASLGLILLLARTVSFLPRRTATAAAVFLAVLGMVSVARFWVSLDAAEKPGARAAARLLATEASLGEPIVVSSPFVYVPIAFHVGCVAPGHLCRGGHTVRLYSETRELAHFAGGPILTVADIVGPGVFRSTAPERLWVVDTTGFGGSSLAVPAPYALVREDRFPEFYAYQGEIIVRAYSRLSP